MAPVAHRRHGNPPDVARMIRRQLQPGRRTWQKPARVLRALGVRRGEVVADVGAGPGFWTIPLARRVGRQGHVFALDPEPAVLDALRRRLEHAGVRNVTPVLNDDTAPMLPEAACDLAVIVNVYHHFAEPARFLRLMARCLKRGGRLVNIDWADRDTPKGPPAHRRISPAVFLRHARRAGLELVAEHRFLPYQYFMVLRRARR
jgi:ubiquinone/menaquinone biosynthesis C-methylase UbiE